MRQNLARLRKKAETRRRNHIHIPREPRGSKEIVLFYTEVRQNSTAFLLLSNQRNPF